MFGRLWSYKTRARLMPAFLQLPPRGGDVVAEIPERDEISLIDLLSQGYALEVGQARAVKVTGGYAVETGHGTFPTASAARAVEVLLQA